MISVVVNRIRAVSVVEDSAELVELFSYDMMVVGSVLRGFLKSGVGPCSLNNGVKRRGEEEQSIVSVPIRSTSVSVDPFFSPSTNLIGC